MMASANRREYAVWSHAAEVEVDATTDFETIKKRLMNIRPQSVERAAAAYERAAHGLTVLSAGLHRHARTLADAWEGDAAQAALDQMGSLHWTASRLAGDSTTT